VSWPAKHALGEGLGAGHPPRLCRTLDRKSGRDGQQHRRKYASASPTRALFATITTDASGGAVNAMIDSLTPLGGMVLMINIMLGEIIFNWCFNVIISTRKQNEDRKGCALGRQVACTENGVRGSFAVRFTACCNGRQSASDGRMARCLPHATLV
jgi:hypothetical protein